MLITGATGFVGKWLTQKLLDEGLDVRILARNTDKYSGQKHPNLELVQGDILDQQSLLSATKEIHSVFHLAGVVGYTKSMRTAMHQANVVGTQNTIDAFKKSNCKRFVHMSSVVTIGANTTPATLDESADYNMEKFNLGYFETKRAAERIVLEEVRQGIDAVIVNPSTIYGPGDATKGSRNTQVKVARGKFPFYTSGGVSIIHVEDLTEAVFQAWKLGRTGERYILAGENITIKDLFKSIASCAGVKPPNLFLPDQLLLSIGKMGDFLEYFNKKSAVNSENARTAIMYHWYDSKKAQTELNLKSRPAIEAIRDSVNWMKQNNFI